MVAAARSTAPVTMKRAGAVPPLTGLRPVRVRDGTTVGPMADRPLEAPPWRLRAMEQFAAAEFGAFLAASPVLRLAGRGDEHPVLVLPGFITSDLSTAPLRWLLRGQGYWVHGWRLGRNVGPNPRIVDGIRDRLADLYERHHRPVSLIGWSLGGIYAREMARENPAAVRQVITLGSPFRFGTEDRGSVSGLYDRLNPDPATFFDRDVHEADRVPLEVPATAIYSRADGVVRWHACIEAEGPLRENIEVRGSHSGLGFNPAVLLAISDRLAQREGSWRPFRPPPGTSALFPRPATWDAARGRGPAPKV